MYLKLKIYTLKNGVRLVVNELSGIYSVSFGVFIGAGSSNEEENENGISHFIEHVTFKGTEKRSSFDISNDAEMIGADINAYTTRNLTCYYIKSTTEHVSEAFEILSDVVLNSVYKKEELEKEKSVVLQEINMCDDTPDDLCADLLMQAYFGKNGYGAPILGTPATVKSFTRDDVLNYRKKYYTADNIVVSVCGWIKAEDIYPLVEKYFGNLSATKATVKPRINGENLCLSLAKNKDINQTHICLGFPAVGLKDEDVDLYNIATYVLGGGMSSRLFQSVREDLGLCYSVYSFMTAYVDCGFSMVYAGVDQERVDECYDAILKETEKLRRNKITAEEFKRSSEQMKSGLTFSEESASSQMQIHGKRLLLLGDVLDFKERLDRINKFTINDVNGLIDRLFDKNNVAKAIVGKDVKPL